MRGIKKDPDVTRPAHVRQPLVAKANAGVHCGACGSGWWVPACGRRRLIRLSGSVSARGAAALTLVPGNKQSGWAVASEGPSTVTVRLARTTQPRPRVDARVPLAALLVKLKFDNGMNPQDGPGVIIKYS